MRRLLLVATMVAIQLATASASAAIMLAVGSELGSPLPTGGKESWPLILRYSDEARWEHVAVSRDIQGLLHGVTFSTPTTAWAYGLNMSQQLLLLRSQDAGLTWTDVSARLPIEGLFGPTNARIDALQFTADGSTAWLVAHGTAMAGPFVSSSTDGGLTWSPLLSSEISPGSRSSVVSLPTGMQLVRRDSRGLRMHALPDGLRETTVLSSVGEAFNLAAAAVAGDRVFLAGAEGDGKEIESSVPAIYLRVGENSPTRLQIDVDQPGFIDSLDVEPGGSGVASGRYGADATDVLLLYTKDTHTWRRGELRNLPQGVTIRAVTVTAPNDAWAVGYVRSENPTQAVLLHSTNGGETWDRVMGPTISTAHLYAIAEDSE